MSCFAAVLGGAVSVVAPGVDRALVVVAALGLLLVGGELFTTGVEWAGSRLGAGEATTGSVLAALATSLPETLIPVLAIVGGSGATVGVGAILGGPITLTTLAFMVVAVTVTICAVTRDRELAVAIDRDETRRDLLVFLVGFALAFAATLVRGPVAAPWVAVALVALYAGYLVRLVSEDDDGEFDLERLEAGRVLDGRAGWLPGVVDDRDLAWNPPDALVYGQTLVALAFLVAGSELFVRQIEWASRTVVPLPAVVVALLAAPVVSNLPEAVDGVIWLREGKDALAVEQITGSLSYQGTVAPAVGVAFTPWSLRPAWGSTDFVVASSVVLALASGGVLYARVRLGSSPPSALLLGALGSGYVAFVALVAYYVVAGYV